jgi:hypothetical protein
MPRLALPGVVIGVYLRRSDIAVVLVFAGPDA